VAQVQQPNGDVTYTTYDFADELRTVEVDPAPVGKGGAPSQPRVDSYTYDAAGNQVTHLDADNRTDTTTPDAANRTVQDVATVPGPGGTAASGTVITTTNSFDPDGNTVSWTRQTQTQAGPIQTQTDSATYDAADRQTSTTDNGLTTRYGYDAAGRQRTHTIVDGTTTVATTLDAAGRAIALAEGLAGSGPYTGRMGYNLNDLPITMTLPGGSGVREALGYDPSSRLVTETLAGPSTNTLGYTPIGGSVDSYDSYNMDGSKITTGPQGGQITSISAYVGAIDPTPANDLFQVALYTDSNGAPGTLVASSASGTLVANSWNTVALAATLAPTTTYWLMYNAAGSASQYNNLAYDTGAAGSGAYYSAANQQYGAWPSTFGASTSINYQYALYATLAGSAPPATILNSAYAYGYNPLNWTTSTTTLSGTDTLVHDAHGRLTSESGPQVVATGGSYRWTYDLNGNLTTQLGDNGYPVTYTYTAATPNQLQTMVMGDGQPTTFYGYDAHGDTTAITNGLGTVSPAPKNALNTHMTYDSQARPVQLTFLDRVAPSTTTITATVTLAYNPNGQRSEYTLAEPGQATLDEQFTYRGGMLGQLRVTKGGTLLYTDTYLYTDAGAPYELLRTNGSGATSRYWYELDGRGNVVALTDINGKVVDRYAYDSWGELTSNDATDETVPQQLRYAGYWYDEKLSWYWLSVRYYDPEIERFLAPDPSEQDGVRTYAYVNDDPIDLTDPTGLDGGVGLSDGGIISFFLIGATIVIAVATAPEVLAAGTAVLGSVILVGAATYTVRQVATGNPASIPVPCTTGPPPIGTIAPSPIPGGTTVPGASSCTAATAIPVYIKSVTIPNSVNASGHGYIPAPRSLPAFPTARRARPKTPFGGGLRARWVDGNGNIYEWDSQHGKVEKYDRRGRHLGEFDPVTGQQTKPADPTRRVQP